MNHTPSGDMKFYRLRINEQGPAADPSNYACVYAANIHDALEAVRREFRMVGSNNGIPTPWPKAPRDGEHVLS